MNKKIQNNVHIGSADHSTREFRDVTHETFANVPPVKYDANYSKIPVQHQHKIGICTAEAVCTLIEYFRNDGVVLSRRFTFLVGKTLVDGNLYEGSSIKSMLHGAYKYGTQPESVIPSDTTMAYADFINFDITPYLNTAKKIPGYVNVLVDNASLASGVYTYGGIACRFECGESWYTSLDGRISWNSKDILPLRHPKVVVTGHAVVQTGYDFSDASYPKAIIRNSWSKKWADEGDGYSNLKNYFPTEAWAILPTAPVIADDLSLPFKVDMHSGQTSPEINRLQRKLKKLGYLTITNTTNFYGTETKKAVLAFQTEKGLVKFGIESLFGYYCGPRTRQALNLA